MFLVITMSGCTNKTTPLKIEYPVSLFQCMDKPSGEGITTDNQLGVFIARLEARGDDCAARLKTVGEMIGE